VILDVHGHLSAPAELYAYKANLLAGRGLLGRGDPVIGDEKLGKTLAKHVDLLAGVGTDMQLISPRPYQLMHSEQPEKIVDWFVQANNDLIARACGMHPTVFQGVCGLPQNTSGNWAPVLDELDRCVTELGFVGCMINPDPAEGLGGVPTMDNEFWYPLYEKMVELDMPGLLHPAGCKDLRESYSAHFISEESVAVLNLCGEDSTVFQDFPNLRLIVAHGGGSVPYQIGRWRATRIRKAGRAGGELESFDQTLRRLWFDTSLYNKESIELLIKVVGVDRCLFATENPGTGSARDPETGVMLDDLKVLVDSIDWLSDEDRHLLYERNARTVFPALDKILAAV
jgi:4-oxalmesaconate hydratase